MERTDDGAEFAEIEAAAIEMVREAGLILGRRFGTAQDVDYKDEEKTDPVSEADRECQEHIVAAIRSSFPGHAVIGEEDTAPEDSVAPDYVWLVDPLDGTKNFLAGLPIYASSVGVLRRGVPVVGAVFVPWPDRDGGTVNHARKGGGAYAGGENLSVSPAGRPLGGSLVALPGHFGGAYRFSRRKRHEMGEVRVTGSIAYELAMTARGVIQYGLTSSGRLWDVAAGALLVAEGGGSVMLGSRVAWRLPLAKPRLAWEPLDSFVPSWESGKTTLKELRDWSRPLLAGGPEHVALVAESLVVREPLLRRAANLIGRRRRGQRPDSPPAPLAPNPSP